MKSSKINRLKNFFFKKLKLQNLQHKPFKKHSSLSNNVILIIILVVTVLASCNNNDDELLPEEPWVGEVQQLKAATAHYHDISKAIEEGYSIDLTGYRSQMGHHYLKGDLLDGQFDVEKPEVLLYAPDSAGDLQLVGVEYATIIKDMDNPPPAPEGLKGNTDVWSINTEFNVWTLHVWIVLDNPNGIFSAMNPSLP